MLDLAMLVMPHSSNAKTGDIVQSYSHRATCPNRCPFKNNGCYADNFHVSMAWNRCENREDSRYVATARDLTLSLMSAVCEHSKKESIVMFRHNVAGDIAHENSDMIDCNRLEALANACGTVAKTLDVKVMGYTYTHCQINLQNALAVREATAGGFVVNFSCETLSEVKEAKGLGCDAVLTSVNPKESVGALKAEGFKALQCPAQTKEGVTCKTCRLCARHRDAVIVFDVHGNGAKKARKVIMLKTGKVA